MIRALVDMRGLTAMAIAAATGVWGVTTYPPAADNVFLQLIALREPVIFRALMHGYAALWFSTSFMAASFVLSMAAIVAYRRPPTPRNPRAPTVSETRDAPSAHTGPWRDASPHDAWARAGADVAHDSTAGPLHGCDDSGRRWHGKDVRVHVPVC